MTGKQGRPKKPVVDPATLAVLTIPETLAFLRALGRGLSRRTLQSAILEGRLPAQIDDLRHDRFGHPLLMIRRVDLLAWLAASLRPLEVQTMATVSRRSA